MKITRLTVGAFESNCYILERNGARLLVDPGADAERVLRTVGVAAPVAILLTHGHMDHLSALPRLCGAWPGVPVYLHAADRTWALSPANCIPPYYEPTCLAPDRVTSLPIGIWESDPFTFDVLPTPGHTQGGVCFYNAQAAVVFTGDTLFLGTVGRTDLPVSNPRALTESLRLLARLPPDTRVYPGHGSDTTIGREIAQNFFMAAAARRVGAATP